MMVNCVSDAVFMLKLDNWFVFIHYIYFYMLNYTNKDDGYGYVFYVT